MIVTARATPTGAPATPDGAPAVTGDAAFAALLAALTGVVPMTGTPLPPAPASAPAAEEPQGVDVGALGAAGRLPSRAAALASGLPQVTVATPPGAAIPVPAGVPAPSALATTAAAAPAALPPTAAVDATPVVRPPGHPAARPVPHASAKAVEHAAAPSAVQAAAAQVQDPPPPAPAGDAPLPSRAPVPAAAPAEAPSQGVAVVAAAPVTAPPPATPAPAHVSGPARHVPAAVVEAARRLHTDGTGRTSLVVRLDPPELGSVVVRLTVQDGRVDVTLRTPDAAVGSLRAQNADVQSVLAAHGLDLGAFDVSTSTGTSTSTPQQSSSGGSGAAGEGHRGSPDRATPHSGRTADGSADVMDDADVPQRAGTWL